MILVDSTNYISWMRQGKNPVRILAPYVRSGEIVSCGIIRIEVLRGLIKPRVKTEIGLLLDTIREIALTRDLLAEVAEQASSLDRTGRILPITDLMIAACARRADATVITEDPHFEQIPGLRTAKML